MTTLSVPIVRTALFVDFDNLFISLEQLDSSIAEQFASRPDKWMSWLEEHLPFDPLSARKGAIRRLLVRKCYLNPQAFANYRPYFIRNAFEVVDCPPLTSRGKTSTDIHMVMDIMDTLASYPNLDEYVVLSGDADFTPVLLRLRKNDKRTVVFPVGYVSPAYKAACDYLISQDDFIRSALGMDYSEEEAEERAGGGDRAERAQPASEELLARMAAALRERASVPGGIEAHMLPAVYKEFPEFRSGMHWLGFYSLRRLTEALVKRDPDLMILELDPWRVVSRSVEMPAVSAEASVPAAAGEQPAAAEPITQPISLTEAALREQEFARKYPALAPLARKVHQLTDTPYLLPEQYALIFEEIARDVNEAGFQLTRTSKTVRDRCVEKGAPIARAHVNFVLVGLQYSGYHFEQGAESAERIAAAFARNVLTLCHTAQLVLEPQQEQMILDWVSGRG